MSTFSGFTELRVRYAETDQMGVVYHANYLVWCEVGRTDLMRELGFPYSELEQQGVRLAVAEASLRYGAGARYDDLIRITTRLGSVRSRAITFEYEIARVAPGPLTPLASASTRLIATDRDGRTRTLPTAILERFRNVAAEVS
jgi:acyl-CoA thioester hydrolase